MGGDGVGRGGGGGREDEGGEGSGGGPAEVSRTEPVSDVSRGSAEVVGDTGGAVGDGGGGGDGARDRRRRGRMTALGVGERVRSWALLRCGIEPKTLAAVAAVLLAVSVFAVHHFWTGRPQTVRAPAAEPARPRPAPAPPPMAGRDARRVVVDIVGKVRTPGVRRLPAGSRVADALRAAGGVREGADTSGLNRARVLTDGEQIAVGKPPAAAAAQGAAPGGASGPAGPVSLNSATAAQLDTLPGVGPVLAQHILDYRSQHGGFTSIDDLRHVNGIGARRFADLRPLVQP
ncbi:ComEA family DNA-binding protein [Streptomyces sp. NPDC050617]|uniref:ComEA family DNA-binding protein n=1 Tax=Streptomyces sp. NPDC050617 TaxID=3154628 RepID=UPI003438DB51